MQAPIAPRKEKICMYHGESFPDSWYWLREKENPEVISYLKAENDYTASKLAHTQPLQEKLYHEMLGRIQEDDTSPPARKGSYLYYTRTEEGKAYAIHCRRKNAPGAAEEIILDENALAANSDFFDLGSLSVSYDETMAVYSIDSRGYEEYTLRFKNLITGQDLPDSIEKTSGSVEWANDNRTVFYVTLDEVHRPFKLFRHTLGESGPDTLVFHEPDESFFLGLDKSRDDQYLFVELGSMVTSEVHFLDAFKPFGEFTVVQPREKKVEYAVEHHKGTFFIVTNADHAKNFKLVSAPVSAPGRDNWKEVMSYDSAIKLDAVAAFREHLAIQGRREGYRFIRILNLTSNQWHDLTFPDAVYTCSLDSNPEADTDVVRFTYSSPATPTSVFDYQMNTRERTLLKEQIVKGGYDRTQYATERIFATAEDGTRVPVSLVYRKDRRRTGPQPLFLYAYGSYGHSIEPQFSSNRLSLLDRGLIFAIAHIRGGGEMGRTWYEDGKFLKKKNTFTDFIACAGHLIQAGYTAADQIIISGGSAGGLLMGAVVNMRPDLFHAAIAHVPYVDVINTMMDASIPLTVIEYEEWGNPNDREYFDYMLSYSPYDNVEAKNYPHLLITAGLNDPRVHYWEPAKWCAKLRATKTDNNRLLLRTNMDAGHQGASGRYGFLKEIAIDYAFALDVLGIKA